MLIYLITAFLLINQSHQADFCYADYANPAGTNIFSLNLPGGQFALCYHIASVGIFYQIFNPDNTPAIAEVEVLSGNHGQCHMAYRPQTQDMVLTFSINLGGSQNIGLIRFDLDGGVIDTYQTVATSGGQLGSSRVALRENNKIVAFYSDWTSTSRLYYQLYDANVDSEGGTVQITHFGINVGNIVSSHTPSFANGCVLFSWLRKQTYGGGTFFTIFDSDMNEIFSSQVIENAEISDNVISVALTEDDDFIYAHVTRDAPEKLKVYKFDQDGNLLLGPTTQTIDFRAQNIGGDIEILADGRIVLLLHSKESGNQLFASIFNPDLTVNKPLQRISGGAAYDGAIKTKSFGILNPLSGKPQIHYLTTNNGQACPENCETDEDCNGNPCYLMACGRCSNNGECTGPINTFCDDDSFCKSAEIILSFVDFTEEEICSNSQVNFDIEFDFLNDPSLSAALDRAQCSSTDTPHLDAIDLILSAVTGPGSYSISTNDLYESETYAIQITSLHSSQTFTFTTPAKVFTVAEPQIIGFSNNQNVNVEDGFALEAAFDISSCAAFNSDPFTLTYLWSCESADTGEPCDDPEGIFDVPYVDEPNLVVPYQYEWLDLKFTVEVTDSFGAITTTSDPLTLKFQPNLIGIQNNDPRCYMKILNVQQMSQYLEYSDILWEQLAEAGENQEDLEEYIEDFQANSLVIKSSMIDVGAEYSFRASYIDSNENEVITSRTFNPIESLPRAMINSNLTQQWVASHVNYLVAQSECMPQGFIQQWTQLSGSEIQVEDLILEVNQVTYNNILKFDACTLRDNSLYEFRFGISDGQDSASYDVTIQTVGQQEFRAHVIGGNQQHQYKEKITLEAQIITPYDLCPGSSLDTETFKYGWQCSLYNINTLDYDIECNDPTNIFDQVMSTEILKIPSKTFLAGDTVKITLEVLNDDSDLLKAEDTFLSIVNYETVDLAIECINEDVRYSCYEFSSTNKYLFKANMEQNSGSFSDFNLVQSEWSTSPILSSQQFFNQLRNYVLMTPQNLHSYLTQQEFLSSSSTTYSSTLLITNSSLRASSQQSLPINQPPSDGNLQVIPEEGLVLFQTFIIRADGWEDTDLPLEYRFYFINEAKNVGYQESDDPKIITAGQKRLLGRPSQTSEMRTALTLDNIKPEYEDITIVAEIRDAYGSFSVITQEVRLANKNFGQRNRAKLIGDLVEVLQYHTDPFDKVLQLSLNSFYARGFDYSLEEVERSRSKCECGQRGGCPSGEQTCICDPRFALPHCTLRKSTFDDLVENKAKILNVLDSAYEVIIEMDNIQHFEGGKIMLDILNDLTKNSLISSLSVIEEAFSLFDEIVDLIDFDHLLNRYLGLQVAEIFDNILDYIGVNDCEGETSLSDKAIDSATKFLTKITDGLTSYQLPNQENGQIRYKMKNFDLYVYRITECSLNGFQIEGGDSSPNLYVYQKEGATIDCFNEVKFSYFSFNDELMNCDLDFNERVDDSIFKNILILQMIDAETGEGVQEKFKVQISLPYDRCNLDNCSLVEDQACICDGNSNIFDPKEQLESMLQNSNLDKILSGEAFSTNLFRSPQFWLSVIFGIGSLVTAIIVKKKALNYCLLEKFLQDEKATKAKAFFALFVLTHPALNGPLIKSIKPTKIIRISLYYTRFLMTTALVAILGSNEGFSGIGRVLSTSLTLQVNVIVLLIPFVTVIPLEVLLRKMLTESKHELNNSRIYKVKRGIYWVGIALIILISIGSFLVICRIGINASHDENIQLLGTTAITIGQDWLLTPLIFMLLQIILNDNESLKLLSHTNNQINSPKEDLTMPSSSNKNLSKVFPFSQIKSQTMDVKNSKDLDIKEQRNETEEQGLQEIQEDDKSPLDTGKRKQSIKIEEEPTMKDIEQSVNSMQRLKGDEKASLGDQMSIQLDENDQLSIKTLKSKIFQKLGSKLSTDQGQTNSEVIKKEN